MKREEVIEEAAKRLLKDVNPKHGRPVSSQLASDIRLVAGAVFEKALTPTEDEREALARWLHLRFSHAAPISQSSTWEGLSDRFKAAWLDLAGDAPHFHHSVVPEPSAEPKHDESCAEWCNHCQVCGEGIRYGSRCREHYQNQPQGEPSDAQESIRVASPDTWGWDGCVVCGSKDVTDRGMVVMVSETDGVYVCRIAWCDGSQECRDDLRQTGASMLTEDQAEAIDAALRAAGEVRS